MSRLANLRPFRIFALAALMALGAALQLSGSTPTHAAGTTYTVLVGGGQGGVSVETFRPNVIMVSPGDSVKFTNQYDEIHTVTFPAGATSGLDFVVPVPQLKGP